MVRVECAVHSQNDRHPTTVVVQIMKIRFLNQDNSQLLTQQLL
jgi:hypothetical protein